MDFIKNNDIMIHNDGTKFATVDGVFVDGRLRTGHERNDVPDGYLERRKKMEDKLTRKGDVDPIYAETNSDWKDSVASNFYSKNGAGLHYKLKGSVKDKCTYSLGDSLKVSENFSDDPMSSDPALVLSFIDLSDDGIVMDQNALKNSYIESQIWKPVTKEDIETVYANEDFYNRNKDWFDKNFADMNIEIGDY